MDAVKKSAAGKCWEDAFTVTKRPVLPYHLLPLGDALEPHKAPEAYPGFTTLGEAVEGYLAVVEALREEGAPLQDLPAMSLHQASPGLRFVSPMPYYTFRVDAGGEIIIKRGKN